MEVKASLGLKYHHVAINRRNLEGSSIIGTRSQSDFGLLIIESQINALAIGIDASNLIPTVNCRHRHIRLIVEIGQGGSNGIVGRGLSCRHQRIESSPSDRSALRITDTS